MKIEALSSKIELTVCTENVCDREICGCYICDFLSWVIGKAKENDIWITVQNNVNVAAVAVLCDVSCVLLAENVHPDEQLKARCEREGIPVYSTPASAFEAAAAIKDLL